MNGGAGVSWGPADALHVLRAPLLASVPELYTHSKHRPGPSVWPQGTHRCVHTGHQ